MFRRSLLPYPFVGGQKTVTQATPIPAPDTFPVKWPDPAMEAHFWTWDQMHQPHPLTPLTATVEAPAFVEG